jgi:hypothetical protein
LPTHGNALYKAENKCKKDYKSVENGLCLCHRYLMKCLCPSIATLGSNIKRNEGNKW